ncbi:MAG: hypothetical protein HOQ01_06580 [Lysobacter sp.]|nr:hypothetical protein [Lysobacter sp.]
MRIKGRTCKDCRQPFEIHAWELILAKPLSSFSCVQCGSQYTYSFLWGLFSLAASMGVGAWTGLTIAGRPAPHEQPFTAVAIMLTVCFATSLALNYAYLRWLRDMPWRKDHAA